MTHPADPTPKFFDWSAFASALDHERRSRSLSWRRVSVESGVSPSTLSRLGQGGRPDADGLVALALWSTLDLRIFVRTSRRGHERTDTLSSISAVLHLDPALSAQNADTLSDLVRSVYIQLVGEEFPTGPTDSAQR
jgi:transcriptional regulator with XRE-family HTH domain